ncbi:MAG: FG-GAP-like repeat-containing protein [Rikenellaceae bacterium]|nr:FG-GAP-like repeat-containing protein [Rikenellaceae bacterium]MCL2693380.1 FG-GAP-like repeat-containing protein [Rikenellaceae bacterium]
MKKILLLAAAIFCLTAWDAASQRVQQPTLRGTFPSAPNGAKLYLQHSDNSIDSTVVQRGNFRFDLRNIEPDESLLIYVDENGQRTPILFYLDYCDTEMTIEAETYLSGFGYTFRERTVRGNPTDVAMKELNDMLIRDNVGRRDPKLTAKIKENLARNDMASAYTLWKYNQLSGLLLDPDGTNPNVLQPYIDALPEHVKRSPVGRRLTESRPVREPAPALRPEPTPTPTLASGSAIAIAPAGAPVSISLGSASEERPERDEPEEVVKDDPNARTTNFPVLKPLVMTPIPGAPILSQPQRIDGSLFEIRTEKHGLVYPAFFDWNGDGRLDLLLGEFETGQTGSNIRVFLNVGTNENPQFTGEWFYATDINGDIITNYQWCCIGIHPRFVDFDGNGYLDILSGQYNPGLISLWRGSAEGFLPRVFVDQEGYREGVGGMQPMRIGEDGERLPPPGKDSPESNSYWNYTTAEFADFNGNGLLDLFVGGSGGLRVALNIGTKENPKFGLRQPLLHVDGTALTVGGEREAWKSYIHPVDWDGDGVLDLLITYEYTSPGHYAIEFFKGVQTPDGLRFEKGVPLFTTADGSKALPGCQPMITITDFNGDGIPDIVFGLSIPTINGYEAVPEVAWEWHNDLRIQTPGKDPGRQLKWSGGIEGTIERIESGQTSTRFLIGNLEDYKYLTMRHRGYVFVMYGSRPDK